MTHPLQARPPMLSTLNSAHGHPIRRRGDGMLVQTLDGATSATRILLLRNAERPEIGFLLSEDRNATGLLHQLGLRHFRPVWLNATSKPDRLALRDPTANLFLSCHPHESELQARTIWVDEWEEFALGDCVPEINVLSLVDLCRAIIRALECDAQALALLQTIDPTMAGCALEAFMLLHDGAGAEKLAKVLMAASAQGSEWSQRLPDAPWLHDALLGLHTRRSASIQRVGPEFDQLGKGMELSSFTQKSAAHRFMRHARATIEPRRMLCLVATARDEGISTLEWVAHHRAIGVEHIFLYTNTLSDGSEPLLSALAQAGLITWLDNTAAPDAGAINMQRKAYAHALSILPDTSDYAWTLVVDLDEFLLPSAFWDHDLRPILRAAASRRADSIAFPWQVYHPDRHLTHHDALMGLRYTRSGPHPLVKSVFRTNRFAFADAHHPHDYPDAARIWATGDHMHHVGERPMLHTRTQNGVVCHYALRSMEEFIWKYARGENDGEGVRAEKTFRVRSIGVIRQYIEAQTHNFGEPDPRYAAFAPEVMAEHARILTLPGVADAQTQVLATFRAQIGDLVRQSRDYVARLPELSDEDRRGWNALIDAWEVEQARR